MDLFDANGGSTRNPGGTWETMIGRLTDMGLEVVLPPFVRPYNALLRRKAMLWIVDVSS